MCQEALDLKRSNGGEGQSKCRKDKKIMICGMGLDLLQCSDEFHMLSVALEWTGTESSEMAASTGCTRNAVGSSAWQTLITDVHSARELHTSWTADHIGKSKSDLTSRRW